MGELKRFGDGLDHRCRSSKASTGESRRRSVLSARKKKDIVQERVKKKRLCAHGVVEIDRLPKVPHIISDWLGRDIPLKVLRPRVRSRNRQPPQWIQTRYLQYHRTTRACDMPSSQTKYRRSKTCSFEATFCPLVERVYSYLKLLGSAYVELIVKM